jgi:NADPH-dependent glutamate synthase beta subunit-like oxidoreductase
MTRSMATAMPKRRNKHMRNPANEPQKATVNYSAELLADLDLPPCQAACPVGTDIPSYAALIWDGNLEAAMQTIMATNPFSTICGRVCAAPCETGCKRGENDGAVTIRQLKRFVMDQLGKDYHLPPVAVTHKESVAVVGGGPAGLTAAQDLAEAGYTVHIYEQDDRLGGMMNAIPRFRLPPELIQQDIQRILDHCPGITIHLNTALGDKITLDELKQRHDAVLVTIGLCKDRPLSVPGEQSGMAGFYGVDLLNRLSRAEAVSLAGPAVVVGGGNVAMDMARTALRCGSSRVDLYCLEAREEMPAWDHEITQAEAEGVCIHNGWGPKEILTENGAVSQVIFKNCTRVFDSAGNFSPEYGKETLFRETGSLLLAIGQEAVNAELETAGMLEHGRVTAADDQGRTADPHVFTAGDCTYGPSAIVYAMHHGHRAAHYIKALLEKVDDPAPFRPTYHMCHVPVAQDPMWEQLAREDGRLLEFNPNECSFEECEAPFDPDMARRQAGRCLRCDAQTGTANYTRRARNLIQAMSRTEAEDGRQQSAMLQALLQPRENPFPPGRPAHIEDVVFLSAALTRLVIDPYREACATRTRISRTREVLAKNRTGPAISLEQPFFCTGFDQAPAGIRRALAESLAQAGCGYIGRKPLIEDDPMPEKPLIWCQLVTPDDTPSALAHALIYVLGRTFKPPSMQRLHPDQLVGLCVAAPALPQAVPWALENKLDMLVLDGTEGIEISWSELQGHPDLTVMRDALRILREMNMEEEIALINFGGMRSGTDVAKALAMNCNASIFQVAMAVAMGGSIDGDRIVFPNGVDPADCQAGAANWIKGTAQETAIIARCTGKTDVHNLEPEDMRSITLTTAEALDLPLASGQTRREGF